MEVSNHMGLLGLPVKDKVTGFKGVATTISFDLYGCVQAVVTPEAQKDGSLKDGRWFDVTRLEVTNKNPVMTLPDFDQGYVAEGKKGCAVKSLP